MKKKFRQQSQSLRDAIEQLRSRQKSMPKNQIPDYKALVASGFDANSGNPVRRMSDGKD